MQINVRWERGGSLQTWLVSNLAVHKSFLTLWTCLGPALLAAFELECTHLEAANNAGPTIMAESFCAQLGCMFGAQEAQQWHVVGPCVVLALHSIGLSSQ